MGQFGGLSRAMGRSWADQVCRSERVPCGRDCRVFGHPCGTPAGHITGESFSYALGVLRMTGSLSVVNRSATRQRATPLHTLYGPRYGTNRSWASTKGWDRLLLLASSSMRSFSTRMATPRASYRYIDGSEIQRTDLTNSAFRKGQVHRDSSGGSRRRLGLLDPVQPNRARQDQSADC